MGLAGEGDTSVFLDLSQQARLLMCLHNALVDNKFKEFLSPRYSFG